MQRRPPLVLRCGDLGVDVAVRGLGWLALVRTWETGLVRARGLEAEITS
jgi:hypothetical protein